MVVSGVAPHIALEPLTKLFPAIVSVKGAAPAAIDLGLSEVIVGPVRINVLTGEEAALEF